MSLESSIGSRRVGSEALILDCATPEETLSLFRMLSSARDAGVLAVDEIVHAARTVLVRGGMARDQHGFVSVLDEVLGDRSLASHDADEPSMTVIPVRYGGEDLAEVASLAGMSVQQVVERHVAREYTVAFIGYSPGFAYLAGGDPALAVPRKATPRRLVPTGSVGLAGPYSSVYPREGPGGWQIIGQTDYPMWDLERAQPAALLLGGRVRFTVERSRLEARERPDARCENSGASDSAPEPTGEGALLVIEPGLQSLLQDRGRPGLSTMGVGAAGAADRGALSRANLLVGNEEDAVAIELSLGRFRARAQGTLVLALTGAPRAGRIAGPLGNREVPHGRPFRIDFGETLELAEPVRGMRTVLAIRGGVLQKRVLGSASRDTLAGIGPEPLAAGDALRAGKSGGRAVGCPGVEPARLPEAGAETEVEIVFGPRADWFDAAARAAFLDQSWQVTSRSDRVGVCLRGEALTRDASFRDRELPSEGLVVGSIQVPPDGQPVLFLADHPLTGGYPVIAVVSGRHLDLVAQLPPGSRVRFVPEPALLGAEEKER